MPNCPIASAASVLKQQTPPVFSYDLQRFFVQIEIHECFNLRSRLRDFATVVLTHFHTPYLLVQPYSVNSLIPWLTPPLSAVPGLFQSSYDLFFAESRSLHGSRETLIKCSLSTASIDRVRPDEI